MMIVRVHPHCMTLIILKKVTKFLTVPFLSLLGMFVLSSNVLAPLLTNGGGSSFILSIW